MAEMNRFVLEFGAIPAIAWLDGTSPGEQAIEELFAVAGSSGAAALNIIPDRNYTPGVRDRRLQNLYDVVALAERRHFPVLAPVFLAGARIAFAHSVLQPCGFGYLSPWAGRAFPSPSAKNEFFAEAGRLLRPDWGDCFKGLPGDAAPAAVLERIKEDSAGS
jgi:hypothetical protein